MSISDETLMQVQHSTTSKTHADEAGPSTAPSVQATPSATNPDKTVTSPSADDFYTDAFNFALSRPFSPVFDGESHRKDAVLREIRDCVLTENEHRCLQISPHIHSLWNDLYTKNGCVCKDDRIAIPNSFKNAYVEAIHATHPGNWGMTDMEIRAWWPYMQRDIKNGQVKPLRQN